MYNNRDNAFPSQKLPIKKKTLEWGKKCVNAAEMNLVWSSSSLRKSYDNKRINYDLYSDILDTNDVERVCNPFSIGGLQSPAKMQNYAICNPKIDLLVGESINREFDYTIKVMNEDAISEKEEFLKGKMYELLVSHIQNPDLSEEEMNQQLVKFQDYKDYEYQDTREKRANHIVNYLYNSLDLKHMFSKGFKDALLVAEEVYECDIISNEPVIRRINPKYIYTVRSGESNLFENSDIITIVSYMSVGQIIDEYYEDLTSDQISYIENGMIGNAVATASKHSEISIGRRNTDFAINLSMLANDVGVATPFDANGNIKRVKVYWKSLRKVKKVKYYDDQGDAQYDLRDEHYTIDKSAGEEEEVMWINEWWEGHKLGGDASSGMESTDAIYPIIRPRRVQFRKMENLSYCHPGIVGTIYNTNDNQGVSLMDRMKPFQYLYNILAYNTELAISKNYGKIMRIGLHEVPENWNIEKWLSFAVGMNAAFYDAFKEGNKGASQGKMAGAMSGQAPVIDMEMGNTIQMYMNMMSYIKNEIGEISGVTQQRQGQVQNREAVGNVERSVNQSSHITEYWFSEHENVMLRCLRCLLDTAKVAWRGTNKKLQYTLDSGANVIFDVDGDEFAESEYSVLITSDSKTRQMKEQLKSLSQSAIQSGIINFSQLLDIYTTTSTASMRRIVKRGELDRQVQAEQAQEREAEAQTKQLESAERMADAEREFIREGWDREDERLLAELESKIQLKEMEVSKEGTSLSDVDSHNDELVSLNRLQLDSMKLQHTTMMDKKKHEETVRHNKASEAISAKKAKAKTK